MILGIDPGERRVGVAVADPETRFARPLEVIDRKAIDAVGRISAIVRELDAEFNFDIAHHVSWNTVNADSVDSLKG